MVAPNDPFQGLLQDLLKLIGGPAGGGRAWLDAARSLALGVATDGKPEENPDPIARIEVEGLARVAELHVAQVTGLPLEHTPVLEPVGRGTWASRQIDAWAPFIGRIVEAGRIPAAPTPHPDDEGQQPGTGSGAGARGSESDTGAAGTPGGTTDLGPFADLGALAGLGGLGETGLGGYDSGGEGEAGLEQLIGRFATTLGPVVVGMQFGSAAGHLAQRALGQYALPLPWPSAEQVLVVPHNVERFAAEWSLPPDQVRLWVCVYHVASHNVLSRPHVAKRIRTLVEELAVETATSHQQLAQRLGGEAADPESLQRLLSDPEALLADLLTPGQRRTSADLVALTTAVGAYVDHVTARVAGALTGSAGALGEAWYRYRADGADAEKTAGSLFGLDLSRPQIERGAAFVRGVVERAGEDGLDPLWREERCLPTPAELDAPGLWLERIALPELPAD